MSIRFHCRMCQAGITADDRCAGKWGKCDFCGELLHIPVSSEEPSTLVSSTLSPPIPLEVRQLRAGFSRSDSLHWSWGDVATRHIIQIAGVFAGGLGLIMALALVCSPLSQLPTERSTQHAAEPPAQRPGTNLFYDPQRVPPYVSNLGAGATSRDMAIRQLAEQFSESTAWVERNMGSANELTTIHTNLVNAKLRAGFHPETGTPGQQDSAFTRWMDERNVDLEQINPSVA